MSNTLGCDCYIAAKAGCDDFFIEQCALCKAAPRLVESLAAMMVRCNGHLGQNPYTVGEYKHALQLLAELTETTDPYDVDLGALRNVTAESQAVPHD